MHERWQLEEKSGDVLLRHRPQCECYTRTSLRTGGEFGSERGRLELKQAGAKTKGLACHIKRCGLLTSKEGGQREALARILGSHSHQL